MKRSDKILIILFIIGASIAYYADYDAEQSCLSMKKTKTDSTPVLAVSPFTGKYKRINGQLYCFDTRGVEWAYPDLIK